MRVRMLRLAKNDKSPFSRGLANREEGEIYDLSQVEAETLIKWGLAELLPEEKSADDEGVKR